MLSVFWARVLHVSQANIDVRVMDGVFVKMPLFADVVHGVPNGSNIKRMRSGSTSRCGHVWGRVVLVAETRLCIF